MPNLPNPAGLVYQYGRLSAVIFCHVARFQGATFHYGRKPKKPVKARANVGVGVGGAVIRVEVSEARIGPVVRVTANLEAAHPGNLVNTYNSIQKSNGSVLPCAM